MKDDLLDDQLTTADNPGSVRIWNWAGLAVLWLGICMCLILGYLAPSLWAACGVLAVGSACFATGHRNFGLPLLLGGLVVAQFGLLTFFPVGFTFGAGDIRVDALLIAVMVVLVYTNPDVMRRWAGERKPLDTKEREAILDEKSLKFRSVFKRKSTAELENIVAQRTLVPAAVRAAEIILVERKTIE